MKVKNLAIGITLSLALAFSANTAKASYENVSLSELKIDPEFNNPKLKFKEIYGKNRIDTAIQISKTSYNGSETVILTNGFLYPDSISALMISAKTSAPILLTEGKELESKVGEEISRTGASKIIIIGGENSVSKKIEDEMSRKGLNVQRISGKNRYETNEKVIEEAFDQYRPSIIAVSGENFADSISIGTYSYINRLPMVLLPKSLKEAEKINLDKYKDSDAKIIGGVKSVDDEYKKFFKSTERIGGENRYETSKLINNTYFKEARNITLTTGETFADALTGAVYAARNQSNLVLFNSNPRLIKSIEKYEEKAILGGALIKLNKNIVHKVIYNSDYLESAKKILDDKISTFSDVDTYYNYRGSFKDFNKYNRSEQRRIYGFFFLNDLSNAYEDTDDMRYIDKGLKMIRQFESEIHSPNYEKMMWHGETVARRLKHYTRFLSVCYQDISALDRDMIIRSCNDMTDRFMHGTLYSGMHNHGLFENKAIMSYCNLVNKKDVFEQAAKRSVEYLSKYFDQDGVNQENSPEYHFALTAELRDFLEITDRNLIAEYDELKAKYDASWNFSNAILLPNENVPNIGDTRTERINLNYYYDKEKIVYGSELVRSTFYNSGYDIAKNKDSYLLLRAGRKNNSHAHDDDLTFWLYKQGNIFTEVGPYGFEYYKEYTDYVRELKAHNTLVVDDKNEVDSDESKLKLINSNEENTMLANTKRIKGVDFTRRIKYNENMTEIDIKDTIKAVDGKNHNYKLYFHLDPDIKVNQNYDEIELFRNGEKIGSFTSDLKVKLTEDVCFEEYNTQPRKAVVIQIEKEAVDTEINCKIKLK